MQKMSDEKQKLHLLADELDTLEKLCLLHIKGILDIRSASHEEIIQTYFEVYNQNITSQDIEDAEDDISFM